MKIRPMGAKLCHKDGQTDITKQLVAFHNFAKESKNGSQCFSAFETNSTSTVKHTLSNRSLATK
jgi:hypothetical protein